MKSIILILIHLLILLCKNYVFLCKLQEYMCSVSNQNLFSLNACTVKVYFAAYTPYSWTGIFQCSGFNVNGSESEFCVTHVSIWNVEIYFIAFNLQVWIDPSSDKRLFESIVTLTIHRHGGTGLAEFSWRSTSGRWISTCRFIAYCTWSCPEASSPASERRKEWWIPEFSKQQA